MKQEKKQELTQECVKENLGILGVMVTKMKSQDEIKLKEEHLLIYSWVEENSSAKEGMIK